MKQLHFNYETSTEEELISFIMNYASRQTIEQAFLRYTAKGNLVVAEKIRVAKIKAKIRKLEGEI